MNRRDAVVALITLVSAPFSARAQQSSVPRLGVLDIANLEPGLGFFREGLRELGYVEGKNILLEIRSAEEKPSSLPGLAAQLVSLKVHIIVAFQTPAVQAAKQATSSIPIVMSSGDPVGTGLVASLARPGGNITGMSSTAAEAAAKNLELIRAIRPTTTRVAVLANVVDPFTKPFLEQIQSAGRLLSIEIRPVMVRKPEEFDAVFTEWVKLRVDAVIIQPSLPRKRAIELALKHRLVSVSPSRPFAEAGGLLAFAANPKDLSRKVAVYVDKILKGAKPADLPVEQPTQYELVINMKTAKAIGLSIPQSVLVRADAVID